MISATALPASVMASPRKNANKAIRSGKSHFCAQTLRAAADEECAGLYGIVFRVADLRGGVQVAWIKNKGVATGEQAQDEKGLLII